MDKQTTKLLHNGEELKMLVESDGWAIARKKLLDMISEVDSLTNFEREKKTNEEIVSEMGARQIAVEILMNWLRDIEGSVVQYKTNAEALKENKSESYLAYFPESDRRG